MPVIARVAWVSERQGADLTGFGDTVAYVKTEYVPGMPVTDPNVLYSIMTDAMNGLWKSISLILSEDVKYYFDLNGFNWTHGKAKDTTEDVDMSDAAAGNLAFR